MIKTTIVNVVATASLGQKIELEKLEFGEFSYNPSIYGGNVAYFKKGNMTGRVSVFASGKMISVGTKSEEEAFRELNTTVKFLIEKGFAKPIGLQPEVRNIVITASLESNLNLEKLAETPKTVYEPEQFPGVILRLEQPYKATISIFASGKMVVTGLTSSAQIEPVVQKVQKFVEEKL
jgi:transcription initiation factor TFIID TATA-box-binding protein